MEVRLGYLILLMPLFSVRAIKLGLVTEGLSWLRPSDLKVATFIILGQTEPASTQIKQREPQ
jgi:hypothetical protein